MDERGESAQGPAITMPAFRIWLCGTFRVERRVGATYEAVRTAEWGGSRYPRLLLKALLCRPGRQAPRETLIDLLWPEYPSEQGVQYLNTATTKLRGVLRPTKEHSSLLLTENDATVYRLAGQEHLWVDGDEALAILKQVEQYGRTCPESLPLLEQVNGYLNRGAFLQDEEGLWVTGRRATVEQACYRCRCWLVDGYVSHNMLGQATTTLSLMLEEDPFDEDILCRFMDLLHQQGMTHQALHYYQSTCTLLTSEGRAPAEATKELVERIQSNRYVPASAVRLSMPLISHSIALRPASEASVVSFTVAPPSEQVQCDVVLGTPLSRDHLPPKEQMGADGGTWCSERLARIVALITHRPRHMEVSDFEKLLQRELHVFDEGKAMFDAETYFLSRRNALLVIAALPQGWFHLSQRQPIFIEEEFLPACTASIMACWHLLNGRDFTPVERILEKYLPLLAEWAWHPSLYRKTAAYLAAQAYLLRGLIELHRLQFQQRICSCRKAVEYATAADNPALLVKALTQLGNACYDHQLSADMLHAYQHAKYLLDQSQPPLPAILHSKVLMGLAHAYAQQGKATEALNALREAHTVFPDETEEVPVYLSADDGLFSLILFDGWVRLDLGKRESQQQYALDAAKALAYIDTLPPTLFVPERIRMEITNRRAQAALVVGDLDAYCHYTLQHAEEMKALSSEKRRYERMITYKTALKRWPHEAKIAELAKVIR